MSVRQMSALFYRARLDLNELAVALALADYADDGGGNVYPSMDTLARKVRTSKSNVQRIVRRLEAVGYVEVLANATGGAPGSTRRLQLHPEVFDDGDAVETGRKAATGRKSATGRRAAREGSQTCAEGLAGLRPKPSVTINETPIESARAPSGARPAHAKVNGTHDRHGKPLSEETLPEAWKLWALSDGGMTARQAGREFDRFYDYWIAVPGAKGTKLDWFATWRNWCRRAADDTTKRKRGDGPTPSAASMLGLDKGWP